MIKQIQQNARSCRIWWWVEVISYTIQFSVCLKIFIINCWEGKEEINARGSLSRPALTVWLHSRCGINSGSKRQPPPSATPELLNEFKKSATQPWWLFAVTPGPWTIHRDGEVLMRLSKHGPGHETPMTIPEFFRESVNRFGTYPALASKKNGKWEVLNYNQYYEACQKAARALLKVNESFIHSFIRSSCIKSFLLCIHTYGTKCTRHPQIQG